MMFLLFVIVFKTSAWDERPREAHPGPPKGVQKKRAPPFITIAEQSSPTDRRVESKEKTLTCLTQTGESASLDLNRDAN